MAPAADMPTVTASAQSFFLSNVVPQVPAHNSGAWAKIDADTRNHALRASSTLYVATGGVFEPDAATTGAHRVAVPTVPFKLVHGPARGRSWAHCQSNPSGTTVGEQITKQELPADLGL